MDFEFKRKEKNELVIILFIIFTILLAHHLHIGMYYDDFGNASLSYHYDSSLIKGTNYTAYELLSWCKNIYLTWSGRVLYAIFLILLTKHSIHCFMVVQALVITSIFIAMYRIVRRFCSKTKWTVGLCIFFFCLYNLMTGDGVYWGMYWASASVLYLWPILPFLIGVEIYSFSRDNISCKTYIKMLIVIPLITLSQEQIGGAWVVFVICLLLCKMFVEKQKILKYDIFVVVWSLFSFLLIFVAPGNWVRMDSNTDFSNLSIIGKMKLNFPILLMVLNGKGFLCLNILLGISGIVIVLILAKKQMNKLYWIFMLGIVPYIFACLKTLVMLLLTRCYITDNLNNISYIVYLLTMCLLLFLYCKKEQTFSIFSLMVAAVASVACLLISPSIASRSCIPYYFCCVILISLVLYKYLYGGYNKIMKMGLLVMIMLFCFLGVLNFCIIYKGYRENAYIEKYNERILRNWDVSEKNIYLKKYANDTWRGPAPYDAGFEGFDIWIREYYDISSDVNLIYE